MIDQQINEDFERDFYNYLLDLESEWRKSWPRFNDKELLQIFPEAREIIPAKLGEWREEQQKIADAIKDKLTIIKQETSNDFSQWFWREWVKITDGNELLKIEGHIARLRRLLACSRGKKVKGWLSQEHIQQALAVPIENFIKQPLRKSGKALVGLCPLHAERHPSFYIYPETNSCWCYGCNQGGNAINLISLLHSYSFKEAVRYLIGE